MPKPPRDVKSGTSVRPASGEDQNALRAWYRMAGVGFEFIVAVGLFGFLGRWLDSKLETDPWLMISGFGVGFAVGLSLLIRQANRSFHD